MNIEMGSLTLLFQVIYIYFTFTCVQFSQSLIISPPVISYCFSNTVENCKDWTGISNSSFSFSKVNQNVLPLTNTSGYLHLNCKAGYAVRWLARKQTRMLINPHGIHTNLSHNPNPSDNQLPQYEQEILIPREVVGNYGVYRCDSYDNWTLSAEIYLHSRMTSGQQNKLLQKEFFLVDDTRYFSSDFAVIPCLGTAGLNPVKLFGSFDVNGNIFLTQNKNDKSILKILSQAENYDPRIGFAIPWNKDIPESTFECKYISSNHVQTLVPLISDWLVPAKLSIQPEENDSNSATVHCNPEMKMDNILFKWEECRTLMECELLWKPLSPIVLGIENITISSAEDVKEILTQSNQLTLPLKYGYVQCTGFLNIPATGNSNSSKFVHQVDYLFKGLDNNSYFTSENFPVSAIMQMMDLTNIPMQPYVSHSVECKVSTFLLDPHVEFVVNFNSALPPVTMIPTQTLPMGANLTQVAPNDENATAISWRLQFFPTPDTSSIICRSQWLNSSKWAETTFEAKFQHSITWLAVGATLAGLALLSLTVIIVILSRKYTSAVDIIRNLTEEEINEFHRGNQAHLLDEDGLVKVENLGFNPDMNIASASIKINFSVLLGEGQFGSVHPGWLNETIQVAVKSSKSSTDVDSFKAFLNEIKVMAFIGEHQNIVKFFGAVVDKIQERECFAVCELSPFGNLNEYLRSYLENFKRWKPRSKKKCKEKSKSSEKALDLSTLLSFCEQIAMAMEYLAGRKVIHGDLATRNVLVFENHEVKITDFGLSKKLYTTMYTKSIKGPMPWRWMALESLKYFQFSTDSDVWSFGVTVWEIFSGAMVPYPGVNWASDFETQLEEGLRLTKPSKAPNTVYDWMLKCWSKNPHDRPTFTNCKDFFRDFDEI